MYLFIAIFNDFVFKMRRNYYPQVFLKECKYIAKEKKSKYTSDDLEIYSYDSDEEVSDEANKKLLMNIVKSIRQRIQ